MRTNQISMDYYPEGDMLSVTFGTPGRKGHGYELSEHIYLRIDPKTHAPLGLTILSYSKLIKQSEISLTYWGDFTVELQDILRQILNSAPVNQFIQLKEVETVPAPTSVFPNPSLRELVAA